MGDGAGAATPDCGDAASLLSDVLADIIPVSCRTLPYDTIAFALAVNPTLRENMYRIVSFIALVLFLAPPALADDRFRQTGGVPQLMSRAMSDRFMLENNCYPMKLGISLWGKNFDKIGLEKDTIETTVRSRLRVARLYNASGKPPFSYPTLYVDVGVVGPAHSINVEYRKHVEDLWSSIRAWSITWKTQSLGTHIEDHSGASFIISKVSHHVDKFIDDYLRVNDKSCAKTN